MRLVLDCKPPELTAFILNALERDYKLSFKRALEHAHDTPLDAEIKAVINAVIENHTKHAR